MSESISSRLQDRADKHDEQSKPNRVFPSEFVADTKREDCAKETPDLVDGSHGTNGSSVGVVESF
jgi:hypothetical protein